MSDTPACIRLLIVLRSFSAGGAERQMIELLRAIDQRRFQVRVVCFYDGPWQAQANSIPGIDIRIANKRGRYDLIGFMRSLSVLTREFDPQIIYGYMFAADLAALFASRGSQARVVWGLRSSNVDFSHYDRFTGLLHWLSRRLAHRAELVISNSIAGLRDYERGGARPKRSVVIPNGIDCDRFRPDPAMRQRMRESWGAAPDERVIGLVARVDPMKGHDVFVRAARIYLDGGERGLFVCAGGASVQNSAFAARVTALIRELGLSERIRFIGQAAEPQAVFAGLDIATSASQFGEGFSNSVAEAMACGVPCVVTDVGDSAAVVGEFGIVVPPGDARAMADAWRRIANEREMFGGERVRARIERSFSIDSFIAATESALASTLDPAFQRKKSIIPGPSR